ncbi:MAG: Holliday junction resolvase RecU [Erysipelothrix sp.]|nr:Holliday junction resolvase RecU [Erysipelothrix sp.]
MIQYPSGQGPSKTTPKKTSTSNRGTHLEDDINRSNEYYRHNKIALVHKKPTPVQVVGVDYPSRNKVRITEAYYRKASTTDYNGVYKGFYLDFESKETKNKTSFPLSMIHDHQLDHLKSVIEHKGIAFFIIRFTSRNETYLVYANDLIEFIKNNERKSIPIAWFNKQAYLINMRYQIPCHYIEIIEKHIHEVNNNGQ